MKTLNCCIVDDERDAVHLLESHIEKTPGLRLLSSFTDPLIALQALTSGTRADVLFADVDMPGLSGIDLCSMVSRNSAIIMTTAHRHFAFDAFKNDAVDYLLKPVSFEQFLHSVNKVRKRLGAWNVNETDPGKGFFFIRNGTRGRLLKIDYRAVLYVEGKSNFLDIVMADGKQTTYLTLAELEEHLPPGNFVRVHRSYIVNSDHICMLDGGSVIMDNGKIITVGRTYLKGLMEKLNEKLIVSRRSQN